MKKLACLTLAAGLFAALPAAAQSFAKAEDAIKYRQGAFNVIGAHFGPIGAMATGKAPYNAKSAAANAEVVAYMARLPFAGFTQGSDKGQTRAKAEIWKDSAKFKAGAEKFQAEAAKLNTAAKSGDLNQLKAAFADAAQTCKSCHGNFRNK